MFAKKIKVRFAPSPTGYLHIGGLRTALYNWFLAKRHKGTFILRIEDTDQERSVAGAEEDILKSLRWAGLEPDEGLYLREDGQIDQKGKNGPYRQSERLEIYARYAQELLDRGQAYYCFCSEERLQLMREEQQAKKIAPRYDGLCRHLSVKEIKTKLAQNLPHVIRLKVPESGETEFEDTVHGRIKINNQEIDDQVLIKSDGFPTYHLANVVDDHLMGITDVLRGDEWLPSTPKHILLYQSFGWRPPKFSHMPLLLNADRSKLSKRYNDVAVKDYIKDGYLPEAVINFIALLGWNPQADREIYQLDELVKCFDPVDLNKAGAVFNHEKLDWLNNHYLRQRTPKELVKLALPYLTEHQLITAEEASGRGEWLEKVVALFQERLKKLSDLPNQASFLFKKMLKYDQELLRWKGMSEEEVKDSLDKLINLLKAWPDCDFTTQKLEQGIKAWIEREHLENGRVLWPMRVALSGLEKSPPPFEIAAILGKEKTLDRLKKAL